MTSNTIEALKANGYPASISNIEGVSNVLVGAYQLDYFVTDFAKDTRRYFRDPTVSVAVLAFEVSEASPLSTRVTAELLKLLAPADGLLRKHVRPLVRTTATTLHAVYQADKRRVEMLDETPARRQLFEHGLAFSDAVRFARASLRATCNGVLLNAGEWLNGATPLNTPRAELPTWDAVAMALKLREFVDRFIARSEE